MTPTTSDNEPPSGPNRTQFSERAVNLDAVPSDGREIGLIELWRVVWDRKWYIIVVTGLFGLGSVVYAMMQTEWYRAEVLLAPADEKSAPSFADRLGGLAVLAGVSVGGGNSAEAVAVLRSRELARDFIESNGLLPIIYAEKWDSDRQQWKSNDSADQPDLGEAVEYFHEKVLQVSEDRQTGLVRVAIEWTDRRLVAEWGRALVARLNEKLRQKALREAETNIAYLQGELAQTNVVALQQTIGRLLETELQKLMLARGNEEFAFRVIDSPVTPKNRVRPRRTLIVLVGATLGGMLALIAVVLMHALRKSAVQSSRI